MTTSTLETWLVSTLQEGSELRKPSCRTLSLLTVVIPSYGRQDFLLRQCVYWHGSGATVVIVDGSAQPLGENVRQILSGLGDITYLHSATSLMDRLKQASALINTRYAILLGDDEFMLLTGLRSAIDKLEQNPDFVACHGQCVSFFPPDNGTSCTYGKIHLHKYEVRQNDVLGRLNSSMSDYLAAPCYAVSRTPVWQKSWGQLGEWSSPYAGELQQVLTTYIWGKLTKVDEICWMRSIENRSVSSKNFNRGLSFQEWWASPKFKIEHDSFITVLSNELVSAQHMELVKAEAIIRESVGMFITHLNDVGRKKAESLTGRKAALGALRSAVVKALKRLLPEQLIEPLKSILFNLRSDYGKVKTDLVSLEEWKRSAIPVAYQINPLQAEELSAMEALIVNFNKARLGKSA